MNRYRAWKWRKTLRKALRRYIMAGKSRQAVWVLCRLGTTTDVRIVTTVCLRRILDIIGEQAEAGLTS